MAGEPTDPTRDDGRAPLRLPPQATMGLLDYLSTHTLDEDYAFVSRRREERRRAAGDGGSASGARRRRRVGPLGALVMVAFAVLVVTAGAQTSRNAGTDQQERAELAGQVSDARSQLQQDRTRLQSLQAETALRQAQELRGNRSADSLRSRLQVLQSLTGTGAVQGQGVRVVADDATGASSARNQVLDSDLQRLVNGFWAAGAEAIAIDGQRLTTLSTIRLAGGAITVNARSLRKPYVLTIIGDRDTLPARFAETSSGQAWLDLQRQVGLRLTITPEDQLRLPAAEISLRYANRNDTGPGDDTTGQPGTGGTP